jgi:hypothetical protein
LPRTVWCRALQKPSITNKAVNQNGQRHKTSIYSAAHFFVSLPRKEE